VICGEDNELLVKYMTTSGEMISDEFITFDELNGRYFSNIYTQQSMLMVKTQYHVEPYSDLTGICVYDLEGNSVEGLPGAEFGIPREDFSDICTDENGIYYCWRMRHLEDSHYNVSDGYDAYAQEISIPINGNVIDQLPSINNDNSRVIKSSLLDEIFAMGTIVELLKQERITNPINHSKIIEMENKMDKGECPYMVLSEYLEVVEYEQMINEFDTEQDIIICSTNKLRIQYTNDIINKHHNGVKFNVGTNVLYNGKNDYTQRIFKKDEFKITEYINNLKKE
jgi:hypothetical protein